LVKKRLREKSIRLTARTFRIIKTWEAEAEERFQKLKANEEELYVRKTAENGWSRAMLLTTSNFAVMS
jgi:hypothetical protein